MLTIVDEVFRFKYYRNKDYHRVSRNSLTPLYNQNLTRKIIVSSKKIIISQYKPRSYNQCGQAFHGPFKEVYRNCVFSNRFIKNRKILNYYFFML